MENVLTTNNGESNWEKLKTFGLHSRGSHIGFNRYSGRNGAVLKVDPATGMRVMLVPASIPRTERAPKVKGKRGRPAIVGCIQQFEPQKRGRKPMQGPIMFRAMGKRGRPAFIGPREELIFFGPQRKRGPKPGQSVQVSPASPSVARKRGRKSEADRLKEAKAGDIITVKGGYWTILACGIPTWTSVSA